MAIGNRQSANSYVAIAVLSLVGLADALYLTVEHVTGQSVRCTIVAGCSEVLSSTYAVVAGSVHRAEADGPGARLIGSYA